MQEHSGGGMNSTGSLVSQRGAAGQTQCVCVCECGTSLDLSLQEKQAHLVSAVTLKSLDL